MSEVRVGQTMQWFVSAKSESPFAAIVLEVHPGGMLTLLSFDTSGFATRRSNVWRRGSKALDDSPQLGVRFGCWDFVFPELESPNHPCLDSGRAVSDGLSDGDSQKEPEASQSRKPLSKKNLEPVV